MTTAEEIRQANAVPPPPPQISLAWMFYKYSFVVPIPGMRKEEELKKHFQISPFTGTVQMKRLQSCENKAKPAEPVNGQNEHLCLCIHSCAC